MKLRNRFWLRHEQSSARPVGAWFAMLVCMGAAVWSVRAVTRERAPVPDKIEFNRDIRPIFSDTCFKCHGPDTAKRKAELRMDVRDDALAKHEHGIPIVPGKPEQSEAYRRLTTHDEDDLMPPVKSGKVLTAQQIKIIERWIKQGAPYQAHWAYVKPVRPAQPAV